MICSHKYTLLFLAIRWWLLFKQYNRLWRLRFQICFGCWKGRVTRYGQHFYVVPIKYMYIFLRVWVRVMLLYASKALASKIVKKLLFSHLKSYFIDYTITLDSTLNIQNSIFFPLYFFFFFFEERGIFYLLFLYSFFLFTISLSLSLSSS